MTGNNDVSVLQRATASGAGIYVLKPFTAPDLRDRLRQYARCTRRLPATGPVTQADIDEMFRLLHDTRREPPKDLSQATLDNVAAELRAADDWLTSSEISAIVGRSRSICSRYLNHLCLRCLAIRTERGGRTGHPTCATPYAQPSRCRTASRTSGSRPDSSRNQASRSSSSR